MATTTRERTAPDGGAPAQSEPAAPASPTAPGAAGAPKKSRVKSVALVVALVLGLGALVYWLQARHFEDTDDAEIDGNISNVGARVTGVVTAVYVQENQTVKAGELLAELDKAEPEVMVAEAKAQVDQAQASLDAQSPRVVITETSNTAQVSGQTSDVSSAVAGLAAAKQQIPQLEAQLEQARAGDREAELEKERAQELLRSGSIAQAEFDRANNAAAASAAGVRVLEETLTVAREHLGEAQAKLSSAQTRLVELRSNAPKEVDTERASVLGRQATLELAQAQLHEAELNLSYTRIVAPLDGIVGKKSVAIGDHVSPGQLLFALVDTHHLWATANFRETQLENIRPGQLATVHVDALDLDLRGKVESIGGATGARLSVFPPENATGNYVKVVQRFPVRIVFDGGQHGLDLDSPRHERRAAGDGSVSSQAPARPAYFQTGWTGGKNPWAIALVVTLATFMEVLDTSIANVSLPHIAGDLSVTQDESTWILTSYLVSNAIILPVSGWFATKVGRKRFYMSCVALFGLSSFLCGIAPSLGWLIFFRVVQGLGGGGLGPSEQAILADTFPPAKRGMAFAVYGMAVVLAPAIGPTLGGFITDHFSWRWVFFINVPVAMVSLALSSRMVTDPPHLVEAKKRAGSVDFTGLFLIALGLGALELVLDKGQEDDWFSSSFIVVALAIALTSLTAFIVWELRHPRPVVDVRLFGNRSFVMSNVMMFTLGLTLYGSTVLLPQYMQVLMGYTAEQAGLALSPGGFAVILLLPFVGRLVSRVDARYLIGLGFTILSMSMFYMAGHLYLQMDFRTAVLVRVYQSAGLAFLFVPINQVVYAGVPPEKNNSVSGIVNLSRNMGGDFGIAFVTTMVSRRAQAHQTALAAHASQYDSAFTAALAHISTAFAHAGSSLPDALKRAEAMLYGQMLRQSMTLAYLDVLRAFAIATMFMVPLVFLARSPRDGGGGGAPAH